MYTTKPCLNFLTSLKHLKSRVYRMDGYRKCNPPGYTVHPIRLIVDDV